MARVVYHRLIRRDLRSAPRYYDAEGGTKLGDRFFAEAQAAIAAIEEDSTGHHFSDGGLRRVSLRSLPYHFLYEAEAETIWIAVLGHDRRHQGFGLQRQKIG